MQTVASEQVGVTATVTATESREGRRDAQAGRGGETGQQARQGWQEGGWRCLQEPFSTCARASGCRCPRWAGGCAARASRTQAARPHLRRMTGWRSRPPDSSLRSVDRMVG
eukprot:141035-Chlamydomonas_euryale.AAC.20